MRNAGLEEIATNMVEESINKLSSADDTTWWSENDMENLLLKLTCSSKFKKKP